MKRLTIAALFALICLLGPVEGAEEYIRADGGIGALIALVLLSVALSVTMALIAPKPDIEDQEAKGLGEFGFPTNLESRYIPILWGSSRVDGQNITWYGGYRAAELDTADQVVAYTYSYGFDACLCWGPVDSINAIEVDDGYIMKAGLTYAGRTAPAEGLKRAPGTLDFYNYSVADRNFFGGPKRGGSLSGSMTIFFGTDNQPVSPYLLSLSENQRTVSGFNNPGEPSVKKADLFTAQKGICHLVWEGGVLGERPSVPQFKIHLSRYPTSLTQTWSRVNEHYLNKQADANPAHVIYEILTDTTWGLAIDPSLVDQTSFLEAAEKLHEEGNGFSYSVESAKQAKGIIDKITEQINGTLFQDDNGKFKLKLLRKTYHADESEALLDYDGNLLITDTYTGDNYGGITPTNYAGDVKLDDQVFYDAFEIGDLLAVENETANSVKRLVKVVDKLSSGANRFVYLVSTQGDDLLSDTALMTTSGELSTELIKAYKYEQMEKVDQSAIIKLKSADRQSWNETFNVVQVKYLNRFKEFAETIATAHDMGNLAIQNGRKAIKTFDMQGIRNPTTAKKVAQRKLRTHSYPITALSIEVSRKFSSLRPGELIRVNYPDFGLDDFVMRVIEVGLPSDSSGNVMLRGMRDVFDEPTSTVNVGGLTSVLDPNDPEEEPTTGEPNPEPDRDPVAGDTSRIILSGLPYFLDTKFRTPGEGRLSGLGNSTWHIVGAPTDETSNVTPYEVPTGQTEFVSTYIGGQTPPIVGKLVVEPSMVFADDPSYPVYFDDVTFWSEPFNNSTDLWDFGPYGRYPGGMCDPVYGFGDVDYGFGTEEAVDLPVEAPRDERSPGQSAILGNLSIRFATGPGVAGYSNSEFQTFQTLSEIKQFGYGLALVRPAWANGDPRFDEIIGFEIPHIVPLGLWEVPVFGGSTQAELQAYGDAPGYGVGDLRSSVSYLCLDNVYRGLLDTGIQMLNHDSDVYILPIDSILYDELSQSGLTSRTYRHTTQSAGNNLAISDAPDVVLTTPELERKDLPMLPKNTRPTTGSYNTDSFFWGKFDGGPSTDPNDPVGTYGSEGMQFPEYSEATGYHLTVSQYDPEQAATNIVHLHNESTVANGLWRPKLTFHLLQDDNDGGTEVQRKQTAFARWKQGWMPTTPVLRYPEAAEIYGYTNTAGVTINDHGAVADLTGFRASATYNNTSSGTVISGVNLMNLLDIAATIAGTGLAITSGEKYYIEVWVGMYNTSNSKESYAVQRHIIEWTANTDRTP